MKNRNILVSGFNTEIFYRGEDAVLVQGRPDVVKGKIIADLKTTEPLIISERPRYYHTYTGLTPSKHKCTRKKKPRKKNKKTHLKKRK